MDRAEKLVAGRGVRRLHGDEQLLLVEVEDGSGRSSGGGGDDPAVGRGSVDGGRLRGVGSVGPGRFVPAADRDVRQFLGQTHTTTGRGAIADEVDAVLRACAVVPTLEIQRDEHLDAAIPDGAGASRYRRRRARSGCGDRLRDVRRACREHSDDRYDAHNAGRRPDDQEALPRSAASARLDPTSQPPNKWGLVLVSGQRPADEVFEGAHGCSSGVHEAISGICRSASKAREARLRTVPWAQSRTVAMSASLRSS